MPDYIMDLRKLVGSRPLIACGACVLVVDDQDRILLQHRTDNGAWGLPGGTVEPGETLEETAAREAIEEAGLVCNKLEFMNVYSGSDLYYRYPNGDEVYNISAAYICKDYSGTPTADGRESRDVRFFALSELPEIADPVGKRVLEDYCRSHSARTPG